MAKTPRPSIADQLAGIAATRPRDDVTIVIREDVGNVYNVRTLDTITSNDSSDLAKPRGNVTTRKRGET